MDEHIKKLNAKAKEHSLHINKVVDEISKVIVGQKDMIRMSMLAMISEGHVLLEGVPGLAKTLLVRTMADCIKADFVRLQFTPDLLPADIIGTKIYNHEDMSFKTIKGPIFSNIVLADEINRAPPKVQSALLEAMQESQVSIQGETHKLESPFLVLATQNPIESEGTYKLPEAQVDRFMFKLMITYPSRDDEAIIMDRFTTGKKVGASKVLTTSDINEMRRFCKSIYCDEKIIKYVAEIVDATRSPLAYGLDIDGHIEYGASPRASLWMIIGAKANAMLDGRGFVTPEDVQSVAYAVLRHRIILTYEAEAEDITADNIIMKILEKIKIP